MHIIFQRLLNAIGMFLRGLRKPVSWGIELGARFWFYIVGLAFVGRGATMIHPALGWLLCGLLLIWDASKTEPTPPPRR